jgi:hypothetical protein
MARKDRSISKCVSALTLERTLYIVRREIRWSADGYGAILDESTIALAHRGGGWLDVVA